MPPGYAAGILVGHPTSEERAKNRIGQLLAAHYRLDGVLGHSDASAVYRATDLEHQAFAIKVWDPEALDAQATTQIDAAAQAAMNLAVPHVVAPLGQGRDDALGLYVIAPFVPGQDLASLLLREPILTPRVAVRLVLQAATAVATAHAHGILHRAIKPGHLLLHVDPASDEVSVMVCDFGTGSARGAAAYLAPEQAEAPELADERSDVWSLSAVLWEALSGQPLWAPKGLHDEIRNAVRTQPIRELDQVAPWVSRDLARVVHRGLERDRDLRPSSVSAWIEGLSVFSGGSDRVQKTELIALTAAQRGALQLKVEISPTAVAGMANLARGGRGGTSLPPERAIRPTRTGAVTNTWVTALLLIFIVGGLSMLLGYVMNKH